MQLYPPLPAPLQTAVWPRQMTSAHLEISDTYSRLSEVLAQDDTDLLHLRALREAFQTTTMTLHYHLCAELDGNNQEHMRWLNRASRRLGRLSHRLDTAINSRSG